VTHIVRAALHRVGIKAPINGAHVLRHSAATTMAPPRRVSGRYRRGRAAMPPHPGHVPSATFLRGLHIEVADDLAEVEQTWRQTSTHLAGYVFQCFDWLTVWHATAEPVSRPHPLLVRVTDPGGRTLLFVPLGIRRVAGFRLLVLLGGDVADYKAPLIDRTFAAACGPADFAELWQAILRHLPPVDIVWLNDMPESIHGIPNPMVTLRDAVPALGAYAATPLPASFEVFRQTHRSGDLSNLPRKLRQVAALGSLHFEILEAPNQILETVTLMVAQKRRRYGADSVRPAQEAFYRRMSTSRLDGGRPLMSRLRVGDTVVATHFGVIHGSRYYGLVPGYEAGAWARYSVGRLLNMQILKWCIQERLETFDLCSGDEEYKRIWTDTRLPIYVCHYGVTAKGHLAMAVQHKIEWARNNPRIRAFALPVKRRLAALRPGRRNRATSA
jgi:CelD/BcsL family acetyltransferase involved in cellulose biosynthesis